ncbi:MAG: hypothetical protein U0531_00295 [Dehalococcoidia bacterium]
MSWVCPPAYLLATALPALRSGAERAGRPTPPLVAGLPVAVSEDTAAVRAAVRTQLANYARAPYYQAMLVAAGLAEATAGVWTDAMIEAAVVAGDEPTVAARLRVAGLRIDEIAVTPVLVGPDIRASMQRALTLLDHGRLLHRVTMVGGAALLDVALATGRAARRSAGGHLLVIACSDIVVECHHFLGAGRALRGVTDEGLRYRARPGAVGGRARPEGERPLQPAPRRRPGGGTPGSHVAGVPGEAPCLEIGNAGFPMFEGGEPAMSLRGKAAIAGTASCPPAGAIRADRWRACAWRRRNLAIRDAGLRKEDIDGLVTEGGRRRRRRRRLSGHSPHLRHRRNDDGRQRRDGRSAAAAAVAGVGCARRC